MQVQNINLEEVTLFEVSDEVLERSNSSAMNPNIYSIAGYIPCA